MRIAFTVVYSVLIVMLAVCGAFSLRSRKSIGKDVFLLLLSLIPPIAGNLVIIATGNQTLATVGYYVYILGMDLVMFALARFTFSYCFATRPKKWILAVVAILLFFDTVQIFLNLVFGHAFGTQGVMVEKFMYYKLVPHTGLTVHRAVDYTAFASVLVIFVVMALRPPRINSEKYSVILAAMLFTGIVQTFYIFSGTPVDWSMTGYGLFGILVFYFSLFYRPLRLLDRMLAAIASELPEALFFFDSRGKCIWANKPGLRLTEARKGDFDGTKNKLIEIFGEFEGSEPFWTRTHVSGNGDEVKSYVLERRTVNDYRGRVVGYFLSVRDNSDEQKTLQREIYNATHDSLTKLYNRAGYELLVKDRDTSRMFMMVVDIDDFKQVNDTYGHETGDRVLCLVADKLAGSFGKYGYVCRIGGDEIIVLVYEPGEKFIAGLENKIRKINGELAQGCGPIPTLSVSAGAAIGGETVTELFDHADRALYATKRKGKSGLTFFGETDDNN